MASYVKFYDFTTAMGLGEHNLSTGVFKVYLSNTAPSQADDDDKTDLAEIANQNGYTAPVDIQNGYTEASPGVGTMTAVDVVITATGAVGPFQYAVIYNDTHANDGLMCYFDYGSAITLQNGETFTVDFGATLNTVT